METFRVWALTCLNRYLVLRRTPKGRPDDTMSQNNYDKIMAVLAEFEDGSLSPVPFQSGTSLIISQLTMPEPDVPTDPKYLERWSRNQVVDDYNDVLVDFVDTHKALTTSSKEMDYAARFGRTMFNSTESDATAPKSIPNRETIHDANLPFNFVDALSEVHFVGWFNAITYDSKPFAYRYREGVMSLARNKLDKVITSADAEQLQVWRERLKLPCKEVEEFGEYTDPRKRDFAWDTAPLHARFSMINMMGSFVERVMKKITLELHVGDRLQNLAEYYEGMLLANGYTDHLELDPVSADTMGRVMGCFYKGCFEQSGTRDWYFSSRRKKYQCE